MSAIIPPITSDQGTSTLPIAETPNISHPLIPAPGQRIADFAYTVLKGTAAGLNNHDLARAMIAIGWVSRSDNDADRELSVNTALLRYKDRFAKTTNGVWTLIGVHNVPAEAQDSRSAVADVPAPLPVAPQDTENEEDALTLASP